MNGPQVIVLNGGSSSGKTTLARTLQEVLDGVWPGSGWTPSSTPHRAGSSDPAAWI